MQTKLIGLAIMVLLSGAIAFVVQLLNRRSVDKAIAAGLGAFRCAIHSEGGGLSLPVASMLMGGDEPAHSLQLANGTNVYAYQNGIMVAACRVQVADRWLLARQAGAPDDARLKPRPKLGGPTLYVHAQGAVDLARVVEAFDQLASHPSAVACLESGNLYAAHGTDQQVGDPQAAVDLVNKLAEVVQAEA